MTSNATPRIPSRWVLPAILAAFVLASVNGCPSEPPPDLQFRNTTDPTNGGATFIGSAACQACHPDVMARSELHGHRFALNAIQGAAPEFPAEATRAVIPNPPEGMAWTDVSYVLSGYLSGAFFIDQQGFVQTTGVTGVNTRYLLELPVNGTDPGFAPYLPDQAEPQPFDFDCFRCHVTGAEPQSAENPRSQDSRVGIQGTWAEAGVGCETCHGPGSNHAPNPQLRNIYVDPASNTCAECHTFGDDPEVIAVVDGFAQGFTQSPQLRASGGHSDFQCTVCHDPHVSTAYDRDNGIRNTCTVCHTDVNLAFHEGFEYRFAGSVEPITCESCHMPPIGLINRAASESQVGPTAKVGDSRGHIFRINTTDSDPAAFLAGGGTRVAEDAQGRAAMTMDFVCLRCHNVESSVFPLTLEGALRISQEMHKNAAANARPVIPAE